MPADCPLTTFPAQVDKTYLNGLVISVILYGRKPNLDGCLALRGKNREAGATSARVRHCERQAHISVEARHRATLERLGQRPLLDLDLRLGEGRGAALSLPLIDDAARLLDEMTTFAEAGVATEAARE